MAEIHATTEAIVQQAGQIFAQRGYDNTTMQHIADAAAVPLPDLQQLQPDKEHLALALYRLYADQTRATIAELPAKDVANRYFHLIEHKLDQLTPQLDTVSALFASAMRPGGCITPADLSPGRSDPMFQAITELVLTATDSPANPEESDHLAFLLYTFHYLVIVFWLYDRTDDKQATHLLLDFLRDFMRVARPMMALPLFNKALGKLAKIMMLVFGGARLVPPDER